MTMSVTMAMPVIVPMPMMFAAMVFATAAMVFATAAMVFATAAMVFATAAMVFATAALATPTALSSRDYFAFGFDKLGIQAGVQH
jgi:hypothetical protein